jgi:hypothetical protein
VLTGWRRILLFVIAIILLDAFITLPRVFRGEIS